MPIGHIFRCAAYIAQTGRAELTPAQRRRARHKLGRALAARQAKGVRVARPYRPKPFDNKPRHGSWHIERAMVAGCLHEDTGGEDMLYADMLYADMLYADGSPNYASHGWDGPI